jgi:hypothetical protein
VQKKEPSYTVGENVNPPTTMANITTVALCLFGRLLLQLWRTLFFLVIYLFIYLFIIFGRTQGLILTKQVLYCLNHFSSSFCSFWDGQNICPSWPQNLDPPDLSLLLARVTDVSHLCLTCFGYFWNRVLLFAGASLDHIQLLLLRWGLANFMSKLASNCDLPNLSLLSS